MKPTIKMIADYAGVSRGVVDRVLHARPNVNPEKRRKVEEALKKLNYSPDPAARALALKNKQMKVGVVMPVWAGSFGQEVTRGIESARDELRDFGVGVSVRQCETNLPEEYTEAVDALVAEGVKGLAICAKNSPSIQKKLQALTRDNMPVVTFNSDVPDCGRMCFVGENIKQSGRIAAELMSKLVRRDTPILIVCGNREFDGHRARVEGFCERSEELGRNVRGYTVAECYNDFDMTYVKVGRYLQDHPDAEAIYMANESVPGCIEALKRAGRAGEVRVVGHDVSETTARLLREGTIDFVIEQDLFLQGSLPVSILSDYLIAGKSPEREISYTRIHIACAENIF